MAFKNLEALYNEKVNQLYSGAKTKFENGKPSTGKNDDPLIVRKPGDGYFGVADRIGGRSLPVNSSLQDVKRLTLFTVSVRGVAFLAKQQLLQTGNTFEQTRLINPVFAIGNAVPFLHLRRHLRPLNTLLKKTDTSYANVRKLGQLQKGTYDSFTTNAGKGAKAFLKKLAGPITDTISAVTAKKNVGEEFGYEAEGWKKSRPELGKEDKDYIVGLNAPSFLFGGKITAATFTEQKYGAIPSSPGNWNGNYTTYLNLTNGSPIWAPLVYRRHVPFGDPVSTQADTTIARGEVIISEDAAQTSMQSRYDEFTFDAGGENGDRQISDILQKIREDYQQNKQDWYEAETNATGIMPYLKYFTGDNESITDGRQYDPTSDDGANAKVLAESRPDKSKKISYIKDPSNVTVKLDRNVLEPYKYINGADDSFEDAITVSFAIGNNDPIKFRAFITDLTENSSPQYQTLQYIGRVEKFVNYTGVQREASFKLSILAFSKDELEGVWRRINYLTGLTFPYGFTKGLLQPNIVRLTIGNVYKDQPGYISSLSKTFNTISESWDLDKEVPIGATLDMKFTIIEKTTKVADSPFHEITENMEGFAPTIDIAQTVNSLDPANAPNAKQPVLTEPVEKRLPPVLNIKEADLNYGKYHLPAPGTIQLPANINLPLG